MSSWFCDHRACISLGGRIGTDTRCAGCRPVERTVYQHSGKNTHISYIHKVPLRDVCWSDISGGKQVEQGHAGNTAVATACLCGVKHGHKRSRTGVPADYVLSLIFALNICYLLVAFVSEVFAGLKKASNWLVSLTKKDCRECKPASKIDCRGVIHIVRVLWRFR